MHSMRVRGVLVILVAAATVVVFAAMAGSVSAPRTQGLAYERPSIAEGMIAVAQPQPPGETVQSPPEIEVAGRQIGPGAMTFWLGPAGLIAVLALWSLGALRLMSRPVATVTIAASAILTAAYLLTVGPDVVLGSQAAPSRQNPAGLLEQLVLFLFGLLFLSSGIALLWPDDAQPSQRLNVGLKDLFHAVLERSEKSPADTQRSPTARPTNEVHRAWMTLDERVGGKGTETPREVEREAIDAGLPAAEVRTLRRLFEEVRYGGVDPDEERVARARQLKRDVEADPDE